MQRPSTVRQSIDLSLMLALALAVATLYLAKEVFIPLALAGLLAFLLAPLATRLERARLGRLAATMALVGAAFIVISCIGWVIADELRTLDRDLPDYQTEIDHKTQSFQGAGGVFGRNFRLAVQHVENASSDSAKLAGLTQSAEPATQPFVPGTSAKFPLYTVLLSQPSSTIGTIWGYAKLSLGPAATAGLVLVVVIFLLLKREDVRDRIIRLISRGRYTVTTKALDDAATRISKYMVAQSIINGTFGLTIALGLWIIGETVGHGISFPSFILWGFLGAILRFIPYIGPAVAAGIPLALSLAVYPGFSVFTCTALMIFAVEMIANNVLEPWLYGASTGLSAVAILVAAIFWTWLWGPVGLLLSTPLTVCLVVLGKHVPQLKFLDVMLSDEPALPADVSLYQRLLAQNIHEAQRLVDQLVTERGERVFDEVMIPALRLARRERSDNRLTSDDESAVFSGMTELVERVSQKFPPDAHAVGGSIALAIPAHHRCEELTLAMLSSVMKHQRIESLSTRLMPIEIESIIEEHQPAVIFLAIVPPGGVVQARYLCRRLRKKFPELKIVVGYFGRARNFDRLLVRLRSAGATYVMTSLLQCRNQIQSQSPATLLQKTS